MAIYQYYLAFIPKIGLLKKHKIIPNRTEIGRDTGYFEANMDEYWQLAQIPFNKIKVGIDKIVDKADWGNDKDVFNWKTYEVELDNDASMSINYKNENITEVSFRADLREPNLKFLNGMLELAKKYEMMLMDRKGNLLNPEFNEIKDFIKVSNTFKFIENPEKFIDDLHNGKINIE
ncbi:hypothetical protein OA88_22120 [Flavobacterium sp. JRM]|nr:hypothetical protein OA88_22120 [Flavobacterium sp. JRM]